MQFVVTAYDYTDDDAINRRMKIRDEHLGGIRSLIKTGNFLSGGAILDPQGKMVGSTAHVTFESREVLNAWINNDPYVTRRVWDQIDIREVKLVPIASI